MACLADEMYHRVGHGLLHEMTLALNAKGELTAEPMRSLVIMAEEFGEVAQEVLKLVATKQSRGMTREQFLAKGRLIQELRQLLSVGIQFLHRQEHIPPNLGEWP